MTTEIRKNIFIFTGICILALICRFHFLSLIQHDPIFKRPIIDSLEFDHWGYFISQGDLLWSSLQNHPPLYAYFLGLIYAVKGYSPKTVVIVQYLLNLATLYFLFKITSYYFNKATAYTACFLSSTYWFLIYINSFLFSENLSVFLNVLLVYLLIRLKENWQKYAWLGLVFALAEICRPQITLFSFFILVDIFRRPMKLRTKITYGILVFISYLIFNSAIMIQNYRVSGEAVLRTQIGANFYMGNDPSFQGTNLYLKIGRQWDQFISQPAFHYKRNVSEKESNAYFMDRTWQIIKTRPWGWIQLISAKVFYILTGREFLRTEDVYAYTFYFSQTIYGLVTTKLIFLWFLMGAFHCIRERKSLGWVSFMFVSFIPMFFFPIKTRYLMGYVPFVLMLSAYGLVKLYELFKNKEHKSLVKNLSALAFLVLMSSWNPLKLTLPDVSETFFAIGSNYLTKDNNAMAEKYFIAALKLDPQYISAYEVLGVAQRMQGKCSEAQETFKQLQALNRTAQIPKLLIDQCKMNPKE